MILYNLYYRERQAAIENRYTEIDWQRKSEAARKARMRRVQEWEEQMGDKTGGCQEKKMRMGGRNSNTSSISISMGTEPVRYRDREMQGGHRILRTQSEPVINHTARLQLDDGSDNSLCRRHFSMDFLSWE